ncbi:hypothetical protein F5B19DRAFT_252570 [Rostrohypoxylon terebratum]|nr:hypothetical protein F5B19DRAFT_252570 [Rostrohypoxylon terebratum]
MHFFTRATVCECFEGTRRSGAVLDAFKRGLKPTRSGKCPECAIALHREGRVFRGLPANIKSLVRKAGKRYGDVRGYEDDNPTGRLSIVRIISDYACGLNYEEIIDVANRVYTQLKMENNPLTYAGWEALVDKLPNHVFMQIRNTIHDQLSFFWDNKISQMQLTTFF